LLLLDQCDWIPTQNTDQVIRPHIGRSGRWLGRWAAGGDPAQNIRFGTP
jgi:hypothetical protein